MRLRELVFHWDDGPSWRVELEASQHAIVVPEGRSACALRDAVCALLYGIEQFPPDEDPFLANVGLVFEAGGDSWRATADLTTGQRTLSCAGRTVADAPEAFQRRLTGLLCLPEPDTFRAFALADVEAASEESPGALPAAVLRQVLAHARDPGRLRQEVEAAAARVADLRRREASVADVGVFADPLVLGSLAGGVAATGAAFFLGGALRLIALAGPLAYGVAAFRASRHVARRDEARRARAATEEAEAGWRAKTRHADEIGAHLTALESAHGTRDPARLEALLLHGDVSPAPQVRDHVESLLGRPPSAASVQGFRRALPGRGVLGSTASFVLAAALEEGSAFPLLWVASSPLARANIDWTTLYAGLGTSRAMLVFWDSAPPATARVAVAGSFEGTSSGADVS